MFLCIAGREKVNKREKKRENVNLFFERLFVKYIFFMIEFVRVEFVYHVNEITFLN